MISTDTLPALEVEDLTVQFPHPGAVIEINHGVSFAVPDGRTLGIVGESGCGKSMTLRGISGLVPAPGRVVAGRLRLGGEERSPDEVAALRGHGLSMIFQDPEAALTPVWTIGSQLTEVLRTIRGLSRAEARAEAIALLDRVGIVDAANRLGSYPHQLSGGMRQRVTIALALASHPRVLLADEPTTALDVTTQEQILRLLLEIQAEDGMAMVLVTHDLGVVADVCDEVVVMYAGYVVERGSAAQVTREPRHPYTQGLFAAMPDIHPRDALPEPIPGQPPEFGQEAPGCPFAPRCPMVRDACAQVDMRAESRTTCACPFAREGTLSEPGGGTDA